MPKTVSELWADYDNEPDPEKQGIIGSRILYLQRVEHRLGKIPALFHGGFATYPRSTQLHQHLAEVSEQWANDFGRAATTRGFFMVGGTGSGKTGMAWAIARRVIERGYDAQLHNIGELLRKMKAEFGRRMHRLFAEMMGDFEETTEDDGEQT